MYVQYLLGLGGWISAAPDDEEAEAVAPPRAPAQPAREPRPGRPSAHPAHRCCRRAPGLRT